MADEWYYARQGEEYGPVTAARLKQLAASGQLQPTDLVWKTGMEKRVPARTVRGLWGDSAPGAIKSPAPAPPPPRKPPRDEDEEITDVVEQIDEEDDRPAMKKPAGKAKKGGIPVLVWVLGGAFLFLCCCIGVPTGGYFYFDYYGSNPLAPKGKATVENLKKVKKGMSQPDVEAILGPGKVIRTEQGGRVKVVMWDEGLISQTILDFDNDKLLIGPGDFQK